MAEDYQDNNAMIQPGLFDGREDVCGHAVMYCDGASSGNPGRSGIGVVINLSAGGKAEKGDEAGFRISEYIGVATNNIAEYSALIRGLEKAVDLGIEKIEIFLDSELLVRQVTGVYKVKNEKLKPLYGQVMDLLKRFKGYSISHVRRELNKEADALARKAVSRAGKRR